MIPDHRCIVTGGGTATGGEIRIWHDSDGTLSGHPLFRDPRAKGVYAARISPTGKHLATGSRVGLVRVWPFLEHDLSEGCRKLRVGRKTEDLGYGFAFL